MGRYYNTSTGREGKFGFACQNSTDPQDYFGMVETHITYMADEGDKERIKKKLDLIYDKAGIPEEERVYQLDGSVDEYQAFHNDYHKYFFEQCEAGEGHFAGDNGTTEREKFDQAHLAQSRLWLGLNILSDINEEGYCDLEAEL